MSNLQKKIGQLGKPGRPSMGFTPVARDKPRAILLGVFVADAAAAAKAIEGSADVAIIKGKSAEEALAGLADVSKGKSIGVQLGSLTAAEATKLKDAGCDFVISPLESTESAAVDEEAMGHIVVVEESLDDTTLRALGPMNFDALLTEIDTKGLSLGNQLKIVRMTTLASTALIVPVAATASVDELRVLRDSGVVVVIAPEKTGADKLKALGETLKAVPPPRKARREGADIALVPSMGAGKSEEEDDDDDGDDDE